MANDLETMRQRLRDQLSDDQDETWNAGEKEDILQWAVRRLNQRFPRPLDPTAAAQIETLVTATYHYDLDTGISNVNAVELIDVDSNELGYLTTGWEIVDDIRGANGQIHISPTIVETFVGGTVRLSATGRYTLVSRLVSQVNAFPDDYIVIVLAWARAECYRRLISDRVRFVQWQVANQVQNVSINELVQMVGDADRQADDEWVSLKQWQKPVIGRIG